jgi:hypothetical protein
MEKPEVSKAVQPFLPRVSLHLDRRKHKRHQVEEGALLSPFARHKKYWKMIDISSGGMSFQYIPSEDVNGFSKMDIVTQDRDFALDGIPFKVIWDSELPDVSASFFELRRCGVEFGALTDQQESLLAEFIRQHTLR